MVRRYERLTEAAFSFCGAAGPGSPCTALAGPLQNNPSVPAAGLAVHRGLANGLGVHGGVQLPLQVSGVGGKLTHPSTGHSIKAGHALSLTLKDTKCLNTAAALPPLGCYFFL